jgi:hypothetical protein
MARKRTKEEARELFLIGLKLFGISLFLPQHCNLRTGRLFCLSAKKRVWYGFTHE